MIFHLECEVGIKTLAVMVMYPVRYITASFFKKNHTYLYIYIRINMITKLTLSIDDKVVKKAKEISRRKGKSLSRMIEEYLVSLDKKEDQRISSVKLLSGALKNKVPKDVDIKTTKSNYLKKKYGL